MRLLVVEDDPAIGAALAGALGDAGYAVDLSGDGEDGLHRASSGDYDALLLDMKLPKLSGMRVIERLRAAGIALPILAVTARDGVEDRVAGLDAGADDYLVKPFAVDELLARVRALLRRGGAARPSVLEFAGLRLDPASRAVTRDGQALDVTPREISIVEYFLRNPEVVLTRAMIAEHVWDDRFESFSNVINVHVRNLRRKIEALGKPLIHTLRGVGYVLRLDP